MSVPQFTTGGVGSVVPISNLQDLVPVDGLTGQPQVAVLKDTDFILKRVRQNPQITNLSAIPPNVVQVHPTYLQAALMDVWTHICNRDAIPGLRFGGFVEAGDRQGKTLKLLSTSFGF